MNWFGSGTDSFLLIVVAAFLAHESWRWLGLALGGAIDPDGEVFRWVKLVSSALVAGLVARLVLFPAGALATVDLPIRLVASAAAIMAFFAAGRRLAVGIAVGMIVLWGLFVVL